MNLCKFIGVCSLPVLSLGSCVTNDPYGEDEYGEYGNYNGAAYGQGEYGYADPYAGSYASESGDVVSIPGDAGDQGSYTSTTGDYGQGYSEGAPSYGGTTTQPSARTYTVKKGDNLYRIGRNHGVSMQAIIQENGLQSTTIHPGQQLIIP